jgi:hypothetical protein
MSVVLLSLTRRSVGANLIAAFLAVAATASTFSFVLLATCGYGQTAPATAETDARS